MSKVIEELKLQVEELKNEIEILRNSKSFFEGVVENSLAGVFIFQNEVLTYANPSFLDMFGYSYKEAINKKRPIDLIHQDDLAKLAKSYENGDEIMSRPRIIEYKFIKKNGDSFYGETFTLRSNFEGDVTSIGGTIIDVSMQKSLKSSLDKKSIAISEILDNFQNRKNNQKEVIEKNISEILIPIIKKMMLDEKSKKYAILLQSSLDTICSDFGFNLSKRITNLTSNERELCLLIKSGLTTKEIANLKHKSYLTIEKQRKVLRKKFEIAGKSISLESYLNSLVDSIIE